MEYISSELLRNKTILITGGAGFIGSNIAKYLEKLDLNIRVIVFDKFRNEALGSPTLSLGHFKNLIGFKGEVIAGDIANPKDLACLYTYPIDYIFHEAAISDTTCMDEEKVIRTNTNAFLSILQIAAKMSATVVYASSAGVYGNSPAPNCVGHGEMPENVYGFSKLSMDTVAMRFVKENPQIKVIGLRYFNVYGPGEFYKGKTSSMILQLGLQALKNGCMRLFKDGHQKRDFVYIDDVVQANIKALNAQKSGVYNVGYGVARSYNEIVDCLKSGLHIDCEVNYIDNPYTFFQEHTCADIALTQMDLNYQPRFNLEEGIKTYIPIIEKLFKEQAHVFF